MPPNEMRLLALAPPFHLADVQYRLLGRDGGLAVCELARVLLFRMAIA
jgi:hypothetical protein